MSETNKPDLCIVVAWQELQRDVTACLDSLFEQGSKSAFEVILVYGGFQPELESIRQKYPHLKIAEHPSSGSIPHLHGLGVKNSIAPLIAITEAHTTFNSNWIDTAIAVSAENDAAATGGVVEPGSNLSSVDFALYICDYAQFASPLESEDSSDLPGNNIVFKRASIQHLLAAKNLTDEGFWKTFFCYELLREGKQLRRDPRMVAYYNRHLTFKEVMVRRYHHGRCFGAMRSVDFTLQKRLAYMAACSFLPVVLNSRLFAKVVKKQALMSRFVLVQAICQAIIGAWVVGEYNGTAFGAADSCAQL